MKKVKALKKFMDKQENCVRHRGEIFDVSEQRYTEIMEAGSYIEEIKSNASSGENETSAEEAKKSKKTSKKTAAE